MIPKINLPKKINAMSRSQNILENRIFGNFQIIKKKFNSIRKKQTTCTANKQLTLNIFKNKTIFKVIIFFSIQLQKNRDTELC